MDWLFDAITGWLKGTLVDGIMWNMESMFDLINDEVQITAVMVGKTPAQFAPDVFSLIRGISETVILPIAGIILTFAIIFFRNVSVNDRDKFPLIEINRQEVVPVRNRIGDQL